MKSIQAITILASIVAAFSVSNDHVAQKDTEFERFYLAQYERELGALIESKVSSVCSLEERWHRPLLNSNLAHLSFFSLLLLQQNNQLTDG